jgi:tRNA pseudouridine38-40 synthase
LKRIALGIQYDGAPWRGWQTQPGGKTVQDELETALRKFSLTDIATHCAGRTDAGVHALEQVVHFDTGLERDLFSWVRGTNAFLPSSIAVRWARVVGESAADNQVPASSTDHEAQPGRASEADPRNSFHARFSATSRTYHYLLYNHAVRSPLMAGKAGWTFRPLDVRLMREAASHLIGTHDFSAFRAAECQSKTPVKSMHAIHIERRGDLIVFTLRANAFLHHMVRNIVGSLIFTGNGSKPPSWMESLLASRDRSRAAPTFMPDGLYLAKIEYDSKWGLPGESAVPFPWF